MNLQGRDIIESHLFYIQTQDLDDVHVLLFMSEINFHDWRLDTGHGSVMEICHCFTSSEDLCRHKLLNMREMFEKELQKYNIGMLSGNKQSVMLERTNMLREKLGNLIYSQH
jgi:hypothetical protein